MCNIYNYMKYKIKYLDILNDTYYYGYNLPPQKNTPSALNKNPKINWC